MLYEVITHRPRGENRSVWTVDRSSLSPGAFRRFPGPGRWWSAGRGVPPTATEGADQIDCGPRPLGIELNGDPLLLQNAAVGIDHA